MGDLFLVDGEEVLSIPVSLYRTTVHVNVMFADIEIKLGPEMKI